jgi:hypothetical protein
MDRAFLYDENATGMCSEEEYPYMAHKTQWSACASEQGLCTAVEHTRVATFLDVAPTNEDLMAALVEQPVSVAIESSPMSFQLYKSVGTTSP